ncbi:hypothetical protein SAMN06265337_2107 [Hymenobacter gelipurpurascens]|uniref:Nuclease-related domain-containing protein n=1 Tax=Hymenobacter gelipurpurascens TaxID=89968 RepID=A0A212TPY5_9BACT|nr:hypothetical protein [Hymenobacter gelipurpurascens]SNC67891.1 hypothetical protein SAMN06265337_2107 [Hymenobacter gelipurpurascens]
MLHSFLFTAFADSARQAQYEAVRAVLQADTSATPTILLGNFEVEGEVMDAVVIRPHSVTVLLFVPQGGLLDISTQPDAAWQLGSYTLHGDEHAANPFEQFLHQQEALATWLSGELAPHQLLPEHITGAVLFAQAVQFGPGVETYLRRQPGAENFQLLSGDVGQLPRRLRQLGHSEINLTEEALIPWANDLTASIAASAPAEAEPEAAPAGGYWEQKARQLWLWLGAEDIPHDAPYGSPAEAVAASQQEMHRLEQLSQQVRDELNTQRQTMEAREAEREQSIAQLRAQLAQAPTAAAEAAELRARLQTESQEKAALEEAIRASRAESEARNRELDARIQQLGQLIEQMQQRPPTAEAALPTPAPATPTVIRPRPVPGPSAAKPAAAPSRTVAPAASAAAATAPKAPTAGSHGLRGLQAVRFQMPRVALVAGILLCIGLAAWGIVRWSGKLTDAPATEKPRAARPEYQKEADVDESEAVAPTIEDIMPDTIVVPTETPAEERPTPPAASEATPALPDSAETSPQETPTEPTDTLGQSSPTTP